MKKKKILIIIILCAILLAGMAGGVFFKTFFAENVQNRETVVVVPPGATFEQVMDTLRKHEVLKSEASFKKTAEALKYKTIRIGKYDISTPEELFALLHDGNYMQKFGLSDTTAVCLFIPNTYDIYYDITAEDFLNRMNDYYGQFWNEKRKQDAEAIGLTPVQVATLASIVEEENMRPSEKAIIAGLYINRLNKGMLLQSDPTVKFAIGDFARKRILNADLQIDSPYNTYKYKGLPPGPIRIPEASTMDSVLHYRHHNYLYMCAKEDFSGYHNFTASAAEHARNAARYRAALNARNIKK